MTRISDERGAGEQVDASTITGSHGGTDHPSGAPDPWSHYWRQAARSGWTSPVGRDQVRAALLDAGAFVDSLIIGRYRPPRADDPPGLRIIELRHGSDAKGSYGALPPADTMTVYAVPADRRQAVRRELSQSWLAQACAWLASASTRGNAWSASGHEWTLWLRGEDLVVSEH